MTIQTMFDATPATPTLADRFHGTALDPEKGRAREYRAIYAITLSVLIVALGVARLVNFARANGPRRSIVQEARLCASSALAYAYRH